jgi:hypothetical protein
VGIGFAAGPWAATRSAQRVSKRSAIKQREGLDGLNLSLIMVRSR